MPDYKTGQLLNFSWRGLKESGVFMGIEVVGNHIHYKEFTGRKDWIHSAFVVSVDEKGILVSEAVGKIKKTYYPKYWLDARYEEGVMAIGTVPGIDPKKVIEFEKLHDGEDYAEMELVDLGIYWLTGRTNVRNTDTKWICSEYDCSMVKYSADLDCVKDLGLPNQDYCAPMDLFIWDKIKWDFKEKKK